MNEQKLTREFDVSLGDQQQLFGSLKDYPNITIEATGDGLDAGDSQITLDDGDDVENLTNDPNGTVNVPQDGTGSSVLAAKNSAFYMLKLSVGGATTGKVRISLTGKK
jgi:hypothetical protein